MKMASMAFKSVLKMILMTMIGLSFIDSSTALEEVHSFPKAIVVTDHAIASKIGLDILKSGGNAIDAAVAIAYALTVVQPCCGNIGGGGFMLIHTASGLDTVINFRQKAPLNATADMFNSPNGKFDEKKAKEGYLSIATPGTVLGLEAARKKYGRLERKSLISPSIQLASQGFILNQGDIKLLSKETQNFKSEKNIATIFLKNGRPYRVGDRLIQEDLAKTLQLISDQGSDAFYKGSISHTIVKESKKNGGILSLKDFEEYQVEELKPIYCRYKEYEIITTPLPSSGGVLLCEMLNILEGYPISSWGINSRQSIHVTIEAMRQAFLDRNLLGDPNFVANPVDCLISKKYAERIREDIHLDKIKPIETLHPLPSHSKDCNTTHFSIIDKEGNIVSLTYTLNSLFGAKVIAGNTGFFLNNEMDDFTIELGKPNQFGLVQGLNNKIEPGKRPLSSMSPTIILKDKKPFLVLGAAGGSRIISANLLTALRVIEGQYPIEKAVNDPRFHHQYLPNYLEREPKAFAKTVESELKSMGYHIKTPKHFAVEEAIERNPQTNRYTGGSDRRRAAGSAMGY